MKFCLLQHPTKLFNFKLNQIFECFKEALGLRLDKKLFEIINAGVAMNSANSDKF